MKTLAGSFLALSLVAAACSADDPVALDPEAVASRDQPADLLVGVAMSPRSYTGSDLPDFLELVQPHVDVLMHAGDWAELADPGSPFHVFSTLAADQGSEFAMVISPSSGEELLRPLDAATVDDYLRWLRGFLEVRQPAFLGLANEVNMLAVRDPAGYEAVVDLWNEALPVVRELAPDTVVFVTFQFERTVGRHDGWFGGAVVAPDWSVIDDFAGMDVAAFTTYPSLVYDDPAGLPVGYYTQVADHTDLPVLFTEVGWSADEALPLLPGSEGEQEAFIDVLASQIDQLDTDLAVWTFVHGDQVTAQPFAEMDLRRADGSPRPAWDQWLAVAD